MTIDKDKYLKMIEAILFVGSDLVDEKDIRLKIPKKINIKKFLIQLKSSLHFVSLNEFLNFLKSICFA